MKDLIQQLRASHTEPVYIEAKVDDWKIDMIAESGMIYLDVTNELIIDLIERKDPQLFVAINLVIEQARRKELESLVSKHLTPAEPQVVG